MGPSLIITGLSLLALRLVCGMVGYVRRFTGSGVVPTMYPEKARTDVGRFAPGTYAAGTIIGQVANITARNDVQNITVGNANGGGFFINVFGTLTSNIAFDATGNTACTAIQNALVTGYGNIAGNSVTVVQNSTGNFSITFTGNLANMPQANLTASHNLTGNGANVTVSHPIVGQYAGGGWKTYTSGNTDGSGTAKGILQYQTTVLPTGQHVCGGGEWSEGGFTAPFWCEGYFRTVDLTGLDSGAVTDLGKLQRGNSGNLSDPGAVLKVMGG